MFYILVIHPAQPLRPGPVTTPSSPGTRTLVRDLSVVRPGTPSSGYPDPSIRRVRSMDSHDHWFYSVSPREKEARKQEVIMVI